METPNIVVFVVKRYAVRETEKWRYAVRKAKIGRYAVRKGGGGCHPLKYKRQMSTFCGILLYSDILHNLMSAMHSVHTAECIQTNSNDTF